MSEILSPLGRHAVPPSAERFPQPAAAAQTAGETARGLEMTGRRDEAAAPERGEPARFERHGRRVRRAELAERRALESEIERATRKIGKALSRYLRRLDRLEEAAERIGTQFQRSLLRDIEAGRFEDRTPDQRIARIAEKFGRLEARLDRIGDRLYRDLGRVFAHLGLDEVAEGEGAAPAVAIGLSQQITLSVESLSVEIAGEGGEVSVTYGKIAFSLSAELSLAVAAPGTPVLDLTGQRFDIAAVAQGLYLDARNADLRALIAPAAAGGEAPVPRTSAPEPDTAEAPAPAETPAEPAETAQPDETLPAEPAETATGDTLLLIRAYSQTVSFGITRILLDAATRFAPAQGDAPALGAGAAGDDQDAPLDIAV